METQPVTVAVVDEEESWGMAAKVGVGFIIGVLLGIGGTWLVMQKDSPDDGTTGTGATTTSGVITGATSTGDTTSTTASGGTNTGSTGSMPLGGGSDASFVVSNQKAGDAVIVNSASFGQGGGWVVIRDDVNGAPGPRILGAAWFGQGTVTNASVSLLRNTEAGKKYHALLHGDNGDKQYNTGDDKPITAGITNAQIESVFTAE